MLLTDFENYKQYAKKQRISEYITNWAQNKYWNTPEMSASIAIYVNKVSWLKTKDF